MDFKTNGVFKAAKHTFVIDYIHSCVYRN